MDLILLTAGIIITTWAIIEALWTTIWVDGNSAPLTARLTTFIWLTMRFIIDKGNHRILSLTGPIILIITIIFWITFIWLGWSMIFAFDENSLKSNGTATTDFTDTLWYVAYTMFTVGNGDFKPDGDIWQLVSSLVAFSGMLMVTLSVTYILQVISAVVNKRSFASLVMSIGHTPEDFVKQQWVGEGFGAMELQMRSIADQLSQLTEQHLAYPILNYYHAAKRRNSHAVAIAIYDDALTLIAEGIHEKYHPPKTILLSGRATVDSFLETLQSAYITAGKDTPPFPDLKVLADSDIPVVQEERFRNEVKQLNDRRRLIAGLIEHDAWHWPKQKKE